MYYFIIDAGHGGIIDGKYVTPGKRSPVFEDGRQVFEGVFNRNVAKLLTSWLDAKDIPHFYLDTNEDIPLAKRVAMYNTLAKNQKDYKTILISIHANAAGNSDWHPAGGIETFHWAKDGKKSKSGEILAKHMQEELIKRTSLRNRGVKGANFYILGKTKNISAILTENGFMTNKDEAKLMLTDEFVEDIAKAHYDFIAKVITQKLL